MERDERLRNYMQEASASSARLYVNSRAAGGVRYVGERTIQACCSWLPSPLGLVVRALAYRPFLASGSLSPLIEANVELLYMSQLRFGRSVYVDSGCRVHASRAAIALGDRTRVMRGAYLCSYCSNAREGEGIVTGTSCWIGINAVLASGQGGIFLGDNVLIAPHAILVTGNHDYQQIQLSALDQDYTGLPIRVGSNAWIGASSVVVGGVTIGEHAVVAAGAVVTTDVEPYTAVGGVPARPLRDFADAPGREARS
jgi:acetyltransferase-like isoleucine patch superfamily enzyme